MRYEAELKIRIPAAWEAALKREAEAEDSNPSAIVRKAIRSFLGPKKAAIPRKGAK